MAYYPQSTSGLNHITYPAGPTAVGTTLTASGSTHTKGSYAELVASLGFTANTVDVVVTATDATSGRRYLFDIATGAGGAEVVVVPNLYAEGESAASAGYGAGIYPLRLAVASGTRVSARCQSQTGSATMAIAVTFSAAGGVAGCASYTAYGTDTANTQAVGQVDPGGTADTKGSYLELTASTGIVIQELLAVMQRGPAASTAGATWAIDIATGAGGAEVVLIPDLRHVVGANAGSNTASQPRSYRFPTYIASSTRLAVRASCSINTANSRLRDVVLYGATAPSESGSSGSGAWAFAG